MLRAFADGSLMAETFGDGTPDVLALHGWSRTRRDFFGVLSPVGAVPLDALALDLPGFGASPAPPEAWGSRQYAEAVVGVLSAMRAPVVLLGHSFGGRVAIHLAASNPDMVAGLVLTGTPLRRPPGRRNPPVRFRVGRALHRRGLVGEDRMEAMRRRYGSADYRAAEGVMRQVLVRVVNETYEDAIAAVSCPVTLVWGDDDDVTPISVARQVVTHFARATLVEVPNAGHLTPLTAPSALREAVTNFLPGALG